MPESHPASCDAQNCKATKKTHGGWLDRKMSSSQSDQQILPSSIHQRAAAFFFFFFSFLHLPSPHPSSLRGAVTLHPSLSCGTLFGLTPCHICQEQVAGGTDRWSENKCKSRLGRILRRKATVVFDPRSPRTLRVGGGVVVSNNTHPCLAFAEVVISEGIAVMSATAGATDVNNRVGKTSPGRLSVNGSRFQCLCGLPLSTSSLLLLSPFPFNIDTCDNAMPTFAVILKTFSL